MGLRVRLRPDAVDPAQFNEQRARSSRRSCGTGRWSPTTAPPWFLSGVLDERWDNDLLRVLRDIPGTVWEAADTSSLVVDPDSGRAATGAQPTSPPSDPGHARATGGLAGPTRIETAVAIARAAFPDGAEVAYLARADQFADAVADGTLTDGPVLLVPSCGELPATVGWGATAALNAGLAPHPTGRWRATWARGDRAGHAARRDPANCAG